MKPSLKRRCSTRRRWPLMWRSRTWICEACEKLASCLWVDWVATMPGEVSLKFRKPIAKRRS